MLDGEWHTVSRPEGGEPDIRHQLQHLFGPKEVATLIDKTTNGILNCMVDRNAVALRERKRNARMERVLKP